MIAMPLFSILLATVTAGQGEGGKATPHVLIGEYSSAEARFIAGPERAELRLGCAEGSIAGPIRLDPHGHFTVRGAFEEYTSGPQLVDESGVAQPAVRFDGQVSGASLALTIARRSGPPLTLTLARGPARKMVRCL